MKLLLLFGLATIGLTQIRRNQRWALVLMFTAVAGLTTLVIG